MTSTAQETVPFHLPRIRWQPRVSVLGVLSGAAGGLGVLVLLQQFAVAYPTRNLLIVCVIGGAAVHLVAVNLGRMFHVRRLNARLAVAEHRLAGVPAVPALPDWAPTHAVGPHGAEARAEPDPAQPVSAELAPGVPLRIDRRAGEWAFVVAANGWSGWVDARRLDEQAR